MWERDIEIVSVVLTAEGKLEVVRRERSNASYGDFGPVPDKVSKETYVAGLDGKIVLQSTVIGKHTPARKVREVIEFPEAAPENPPGWVPGMAGTVYVKGANGITRVHESTVPQEKTGKFDKFDPT